MTAPKTSSWVVRVDLFQLRDGEIPTEPADYATVKEVVETEERAVAEVERLLEINAGKDVAYLSQPGRWGEPTRTTRWLMSYLLASSE